MKKVFSILLIAFGVFVILCGLILFSDANSRVDALIMIILGVVLIYFSNKARKGKAQNSNHRSKNISFVAFDFETTGLDANSCDIIQAGAVRYVNGVEVDSFVSPAKPYSPITAKITEITGITDADVADAPVPEKVIADLVKFIDGMPVVAHNAPFDLKFLRKYAPNYYPEAYDTLRMSQDALPGMSHKLGDLMEHYGIQGEWHDALSDCRAAAELFLRLHTRHTQPYLKGNTHPGGISVEHYMTEESVTEYERNRAADAEFTAAEQAFIEAFNNLDFTSPVFASKKSGFIVFRSLGCELLRVKVNKRLQYALLPGTREDYPDISLEFTEATATELKSGNCVRAVLSSPADLSAFEPRLKTTDIDIKNRISLLPLTWQPKQ